MSTPHLIVLSGGHKGDVIMIYDTLPVVFGSRTGVSLPEPDLDPVHCQILFSSGRWFLQDFGSAKGTWLGDERIEGVRPLEFGRSFRIGNTHVAFLDDGDLGAAAATNVSSIEDEPEPTVEELYEEDAEADPPRHNLSATDVFNLETPTPEADPQTPLGDAEAGDLDVHDSLGDYDIVDLLGEGSLGRVYKGYDRRRRRVVAIKVLDATLAQDPHLVARFLRGAKTGGKLSHRHIVKVLAAGHAGGRIYLTMEFVDGLNLEQFCLASRGTLIPQVALGVMNRITDALVYAHSRDIIHRNVNPRNILIGPGAYPKLADLALAKRTTKKKSAPITAQGESVIPQTPYAPPEAILGEPMDARSDVWGVGATLFRALIGKPPYGRDPKLLTSRIMSGEMENLEKSLRGSSKELPLLLRRCLAPDPAKRFQKMRDLREAIADLPDVE
jgi:pSer/pThr/pTyr-binding forkhead associated (FHA) protein